MTISRTFPLRLCVWLLCGCLCAPPALAATPEPLPAWDQLSEAQREQLIAPIRERWNADPAQRQQLLERARRWQQMPAEQRRRAHHGMKRWEHMTPEQRAQTRALYLQTRSMDPAAREAFKVKWRAMTPAQRKAWVEANPPPADTGGEHPGPGRHLPLPH